MKRTRQFFSVLLTLVMLLTLVPAMGVTVSAAETWTTVTTYDELKAAHTGSARKSSLTVLRLSKTTAPTHLSALFPKTWEQASNGLKRIRK